MDFHSGLSYPLKSLVRVLLGVIFRKKEHLVFIWIVQGIMNNKVENNASVLNDNEIVNETCFIHITRSKGGRDKV